MIREIQQADIPALVEIYNYYISNTYITFEEETLNHTEMSSRVDKVQQADLPWLVIEKEGQVVGYAYASRWHHRDSYRHTVEVSVYMDHQQGGGGLGSQIFAQLLDLLKQKPIHIAISCIALPNPASVRLHEKFGMEKVGHFKEVGRKFDQWLDVGYWQISLDSDSK